MLTFSFMAEGDDMSEKLKKLKKNCQITFIKSGSTAETGGNSAACPLEGFEL